MRLLSLYAHGFRNLDEVRLEAHPRLNVFVGPNGVGKTNLLEAVHLAAALRLLRPSERASELVRFDLERGAVKAQFDLDGPLPIEVTLEKRGRKATLAGKQVRDVGEVAARIGVVSFTPEDLAIVRQGPDHRRRALDRFAFHLAPSFAQVAKRYAAALSQRNKLLKTWPVDPDLLASYTAPLVEAGAELVAARLAAIERWRPSFVQSAARITGGEVEAGMRYRSSLLEDDEAPPSTEELASRLADKLQRQAQTEMDRKTTLCGPHLDDVIISMDARRARHLASQGEARALVLALKMAEVLTLTEARQSAPLLLLDDVAGELDPARAAFLFATVDAVEAQTVVTCTHEGLLPSGRQARVLTIDEGRVVASRVGALEGREAGGS
jgi:DNA replication and repair protein RecF